MAEGETLALVTGASKGIGRAISEMLLENGFRVVGLAREFPEVLLSTHKFAAEPVDFSKLPDLPDRLKQVAREHLTPDVLVLNAGIGRFGDLEQFSPAQIQELVNVNLISQILVARQWVGAMKTQRQGRIVIIGSTAGLQGGQKGAVYSATKFGLRGFAQSLREECAHAGVSVSLINPGMVDTSFYQTESFRPSSNSGCHLVAEDVAIAVKQIVEARSGSVIDELTLRPQKHVIDFSKP
ncbi:MAG: SDR family oxidoreductase [Thiotrichales bacterium]